jgi:hypothetical protein
VTFSLVVSTPTGTTLPSVFEVSFAKGAEATATTATTNPAGVEITIVGGPNATSNAIPSSADDPADLYGIVLVFIGIFVAIVLSRWLFGRKGPAPK